MKEATDPSDNQNLKSENKSERSKTLILPDLGSPRREKAKPKREREMSLFVRLCVFVFKRAFRSLPTNALYWLGETWRAPIGWACFHDIPGLSLLGVLITVLPGLGSNKLTQTDKRGEDGPMGVEVRDHVVRRLGMVVGYLQWKRWLLLSLFFLRKKKTKDLF